MRTSLFLMFAWALQAQNGITLVRAGYDDPTVIRVAPNQVVTLFLTGLKTIVPGGIERARTVPLPLTLAGISVKFDQGDSPTLKFARLFSVEQFNRCDVRDAVTADCLVTALTVQIPADMNVPNPLATYIRDPGTTTLTILENGTMSRAFLVSPVSDQIHVLTSCDVNGQTRGSGVCFPMVTHADGSLVLQAARGPDQAALTNSEANPGETLVMYAYGLGFVSQNGNTADPVYLRFDFRANASPSRPLDSTILPAFAGLAPKQIGIYQINFEVPALPAGTLPCGGAINSNLTVSLTGSAFGFSGSFDGAAICVAVP